MDRESENTWGGIIILFFLVGCAAAVILLKVYEPQINQIDLRLPAAKTLDAVEAATYQAIDATRQVQYMQLTQTATVNAPYVIENGGVKIERYHDSELGTYIYVCKDFHNEVVPCKIENEGEQSK